MTPYLLLLAGFGFLCAYLAERKGRSPRTWFGLGALLGLIAVVVLLLQKSDDQPPDASV